MVVNRMRRKAQRLGDFLGVHALVDKAQALALAHAERVQIAWFLSL